MNARALPAARVVARPAAAKAAGPAAGKVDWIWQLGFMGAHVPLGVLVGKASSLITWHARVSFLIGVALALTSKKWERVACVAAYICACDVYWRMRRADIPWEFSKYAVMLILAIALVRFGRYQKMFVPFAYLLLMLVSVPLTVLALSPEDAREALSFNMSGPVSLAIAAMFFFSIRFSKREMKWILTSLIAPGVAIATVASVSLAKAQKFVNEEFGNASNRAASGGFGPNQVSATLGLAILCVFLLMALGVGSVIAQGSLVLLTLFLIRQCAITFSRGGLWMAAAGILSAAFYLARDKKTRLRLLAVVVVVTPVLIFIIWPRLEEMTGGKIGDRFANTDSTGRDLLVQGDLVTWAENPVLGAGPGMGGKNRMKYFHVPTAHTEYSRMVAEHGILGLLALILMGWMCFSNIWYAPTRLDKAFAAAMLAYALLNMLVDGTRICAVGFTFGLSGARFLLPRRRPAPARVMARAAPAGVPQPT